MSALNSLIAQYTDSEGEEGTNKVDYSDPEEKQTKGQLLVAPPKKSKISKKKVRRLVSYNDGEQGEEEDISSEEESEDENKDDEGDEKVEVDEEMKDKYERFEKKYGFSLPPEPSTKLFQKFQENITNLHQKTTMGFNLNKYIQDKKEFRNPSIYDKLIQFCDINELGTNFPSEIYDVSIYGPESYYEELSKAQKNEMDKLEKQKKETVKTEAVKRKSKWDQQAPTTGPNVTAPSTASTTKTIIISSTGQLKKPKI